MRLDFIMQMIIVRQSVTFTFPAVQAAVQACALRLRSPLQSPLQSPFGKLSLRGGASRFSSSLLGSAAPLTNSNEPIPVTLLSGFLGSGKTTTLQNVLQSPDHNLTIGVVVNDVASVNIDSKLLRSSEMQRPADTEGNNNANNVVEMQNGCACCSLSGELLPTLETLLDSRRDANKPKFDHILIELSGVADPLAVRAIFEQGAKDNHGVYSGMRGGPLAVWSEADEEGSKKGDTPVLSKAPPRIVTLVDSSTFGSNFMTSDRVSDRPQWLMDEKSPSQKNENVLTEADLCLGQGVIAELLVEQVEGADLVIVNKVDLLGREVRKQ